MARGTDEIEDPTPLAGGRISIEPRIGWLLRSWRAERGLTLRALRPLLQAQGRDVSPATLSRLEVGGTRNGTVMAAYEGALGLVYGSLRTPVDVLCRTFSYAPVDVEPWLPVADLAAFSRSCDAVAAEPTGGDWLRFAEFHAHGVFGLPERTVEPLVARLAGEMFRAAGLGYELRYEALAKLRCSPYAGVVDRVVRGMVTEPGAQRLADLVSAVTELPTPELMTWCGELLFDDSPTVAKAAALGIQNMRSVGGLDRVTWLALAPTYAEACNRFVDDPLRGEILVDTWASCDQEFRRAVGSLLTVELKPVRRPVRWSRDALNHHFATASGIAERAARGRAGRSMLARLLFELLYDFRAALVVTSAMLVAASPFAEQVQHELFGLALSGPDEVTRHGAAYAFANLMLPFETADPRPWLASEDPIVGRAGLTIAGWAAYRLPAEELRVLLRSDDFATRREALFAAGMAEHPALPRIAADPAFGEDVRAGAAYWLRLGGRMAG